MVLGSQPADDRSYKPSSRLSLLSARPTVTSTATQHYRPLGGRAPIDQPFLRESSASPNLDCALSGAGPRYQMLYVDNYQRAATHLSDSHCTAI